MSSKALSACVRFLSSHTLGRRFLSAASLLIASLFVFASSAHAATWTVTDTSDSASDTGSLRYALTNAATGDTITFQSGLTGTITLGSALPAITGNLTITGPGAGNLAISGANAYTVFTINSGTTVSISGLTIANGYVNAFYSAGGILNEGTLAVSDCTFTGNSTAEPFGGGAILNLAYLAPSTLTVTNSTFTGNSAGGSDGGAIASTDLPNGTFAATLTITNSTFSGNSVSGGTDAGAVFVDYSYPSSTASVFNSVFLGNSASGTNSAGGLYLLSSVSSLSDGNNVFFDNTGGNTGGFTSSSTDVTGNPLLLPLGSYGGTTQTMLPLPGSVAICAGSSANVPSGVTTDQRGFPLNTSCVDAGAVQTNYLTVNTNADSSDGSCTSTTCSLRDAIAAANGATEGDIDFTAPLNGQTITLASALPQLSGQQNIIGPGANLLTVSGNNSTTVGSLFVIQSGAQVTLYGLTFANSNASGSDGGGIVNGGTLAVMNSTFSGNTADVGGGLFASSGTLTLVTNSTFSGNTTSSGGFGGAIGNGSTAGNGGTLAVTNSTFENNSAAGGVGGGILNNGTLSVTNSTFAGNSSGEGGGIFSSGTATMTNGIFSGNSATVPGGGAGLFNIGGVGTLNANYNVYYNNLDPGTIEDDCNSCTSNTNSADAANPVVTSLGYYGGSTQTMPPLAGGVAFNGGAYQAGEPTTDQRGAPRPSTVGAAIAVGSVQVSGNVPMVGSVTPNQGPLAGGTSVTVTGTGLDTVTALDFGSNPVPSTNFTITPASGTTLAFITATSPAATSAGVVDITATDAVGTSATSVNDQFTYLPPPVSILPVTGTAFNGTYGVAYSQTFTASGGISPYTFSDTGSLLNGVTLSSSGVLSGTPASAGTFTFQVTATDSSTPANTATGSYTLTIPTPTIGVAPTSLPSGTVGASYSQTLTASGGISPYIFTATGLPAGLTLSTSGVLSGTPTTTGTFPVTVTATDANGFAGNQPYTLTIGKGTATVTLSNLNQTYTGSPLSATATTTPTGLTVNITYNGSPTAPTAAGTYAVVATVNDPNYTGSASGTLTIAKATATVTLSNLNQTYTGSPLSATATTTPTGLTVNITYNGSPTAPTAAGTYAVVATVNDPNYTGSASGTLTIAKATATVTLSNLNQTYTGSPLSATATTTPTGLTVNITYNGSPTAPTAAGTYSVVATVNDPNYTGSASGTLTIAKATATVTLSNLNQTYTGSPLSATATTTPTGLTVNITYDGSPTAPTAAGTYAVVATVNDPNYTGSASGTLTIAKATATITLSNLNQTYTGSPLSATATTTPTGLTVNITYNGSPTAPTAAGTYAVVATVNDPNYTGSASGTLTIAKATATVALSNLNQTYSGSPLSATATTVPVGLTVSITYNGSPTAPTATGSYAVVATVNDPNYTGSASGTLTIAKATATVTLSNLNQTYTGSPLSATATTTPTGLTVNITYSGSPTAPTAAGTYAVVATVNDPNYTGSASGTLVISKATPVLTWNPPASISYGTPLSSTQLDASSNVAGTFTYTPPSGTLLNVGANQTLSATFVPGNTTDYNTPAAVTTSITITQATLDVTANNATRVYGTTNPTFSGTVTGAVNGNTFTESFTTAATLTSNVGTYAIVPSVTGTNLSDYTVDTTDGSLTVTQAGTTTALSASASSVNPGQNVTLTAQVQSATTGTPTGSVNFYDGATLLGTATLSGGSASFTTSALTAGASNSLTAAYQGSTDFAASTSSSAVTIPVPALDFTLNYQGASTLAVTGGALVTYTFQVSPTYSAYPGEVTFSASGLPPGATAVFTPSTIAANGGPETVAMQVQTAPVTAQKDNPFKRGGATVVLGFLLLPLLGTRRMRNSRLGRSLMLLLAITAGGIGLVSLSGCGSSSGYQPPKAQDYTVTVTATSGNVQHSLNVTLGIDTTAF